MSNWNISSWRLATWAGKSDALIQASGQDGAAGTLGSNGESGINGEHGRLAIDVFDDGTGVSGGNGGSGHDGSVGGTGGPGESGQQGKTVIMSLKARDDSHFDLECEIETTKIRRSIPLHDINRMQLDAAGGKGGVGGTGGMGGNGGAGAFSGTLDSHRASSIINCIVCVPFLYVQVVVVVGARAGATAFPAILPAAMARMVEPAGRAVTAATEDTLGQAD